MKPVLVPYLSSQLHETLETTDTEVEKCKLIRNEMRLAISSLLKVIFLYLLIIFFPNAYCIKYIN